MEIKCTVIEVEHGYKYERKDDGSKEYHYNKSKPETSIKLESDLFKDECNDYVMLTLPSGTDPDEFRRGDEVILTVRKA